MHAAYLTSTQLLGYLGTDRGMHRVEASGFRIWSLDFRIRVWIWGCRV